MIPFQQADKTKTLYIHGEAPYGFGIIKTIRTVMLLSSASIAIIRQSILPRAAPMTRRTPSVCSLLPNLFDRHCKLPSLVNDFSSRTASSTSRSSTWGCNLRPSIISVVTDDSYHNHSHHHINNLIGGCRQFASDSKVITSTPPPPPTTTDGSGSSQHDTWVQFQRSIVVAGFETGQTTKEKKNLGKKNRGGKIDRKRKEREAEAEAALRGVDVTQVSYSYCCFFLGVHTDPLLFPFVHVIDFLISIVHMIFFTLYTLNTAEGW